MDRYIDINLVKTRYWQEGNKGFPIILLHGLGSYMESLFMLFKTLSSSHKVYAFDQIGFGKTEKPEGSYTYSFFSVFLRSFMKALEIKKASLVGWSMGGGVALQFAVDNPEMVDRLILIDSGGLGRQFTITLRILTIPIVGELLSNVSRKNCGKKFRYMVYNPNIVQKNWIDLECTMANIPGVQKTILKALRSGATVFGGKKKILTPILPKLESIKARTLIIWGKNDRVIPLKYAYTAKEKIPNSKLYILDNCGHAPLLEYPEKVNQKIMNFLD